MDQGKAFNSSGTALLTVRDKPVDYYRISSPRKWSGGRRLLDPWKDDREVGG